MKVDKIEYGTKTNPKDIVDRTKQATAEDFNDIKSIVNAIIDARYESTQELEGSTPDYDCDVSVNAKVTLTDDTFATFTNLVNGMTGNIKVTQDSVGGHYFAIISPNPAIINNAEESYEIPLSEDADSVTIISWWYDGVDLNVTSGLDYKKGGLS